MNAEMAIGSGIGSAREALVIVDYQKDFIE